MTEELADRLDSLADETTRAAEPATEPWTDPTPWLHDHPAEWCRENGKRYRDPGGVGNIYAPRSRAEYDAEEGKR